MNDQASATACFYAVLTTKMKLNRKHNTQYTNPMRKMQMQQYSQVESHINGGMTCGFQAQMNHIKINAPPPHSPSPAIKLPERTQKRT